MQTVLDLADNWLMLVRVELEVFTDNVKAIHLYESWALRRRGASV
jgi:putative acetyltransferase